MRYFMYNLLNKMYLLKKMTKKSQLYLVASI